MKRTFYVRALWDEDAKVFYSQSDIDGLHIEAPTLDEFEDVMMEMAVDLVAANHVSEAELAERPLRELIPAIVWQRPMERPLAA